MKKMNNTAFAKPFFSFSQIYGLHPIFAFILISRKKSCEQRYRHLIKAYVYICFIQSYIGYKHLKQIIEINSLQYRTIPFSFIIRGGRKGETMQYISWILCEAYCISCNMTTVIISSFINHVQCKMTLLTSIY